MGYFHLLRNWVYKSLKAISLQLSRIADDDKSGSLLDELHKVSSAKASVMKFCCH